MLLELIPRELPNVINSKESRGLRLDLLDSILTMSHINNSLSELLLPESILWSLGVFLNNVCYFFMRLKCHFK